MRRDDDEQLLPSLDALVGATVTLMTAWADHQDAPGSDGHKVLIARKVVSHLFFVRHHPAASEALKAVATSAHAAWVARCGVDALVPARSPAAERSLH